MPFNKLRFGVFALFLGSLVGAGPAVAAECQNTEDFGAWLAAFRQQAAAQGISAATLSSALDTVTLNPDVIRRDRQQGVFHQSFEQFSGRMVPPRLERARSRLQRNAQLFDSIEARFGVPRQVITAIWAMETDFGENTGNFSTIRSLATLAYDCRRSPLFQAELINALKIVQRGDIAASRMKGAWAGELGQTQFMPSSYLRYAIDFDGDGHANLVGSTADALGSTANYLKGYDWQAGQPWDEGTHNFEVIRQWNHSMVVAKTIAYFGNLLAQ
jgi:lytic murein transglycosylase